MAAAVAGYSAAWVGQASLGTVQRMVFELLALEGQWPNVLLAWANAA